MNKKLWSKKIPASNDNMCFCRMSTIVHYCFGNSALIKKHDLKEAFDDRFLSQNWTLIWLLYRCLFERWKISIIILTKLFMWCLLSQDVEKNYETKKKVSISFQITTKIFFSFNWQHQKTRLILNVNGTKIEIPSKSRIKFTTA